MNLNLLLKESQLKLTQAESLKESRWKGLFCELISSLESLWVSQGLLSNLVSNLAESYLALNHREAGLDDPAKILYVMENFKYNLKILLILK
jgi:hypothetical protein